MEEKIQEDETYNNIEYNSLVSAYRKAYLGKPARKATQKAQTMWQISKSDM